MSSSAPFLLLCMQAQPATCECNHPGKLDFPRACTRRATAAARGADSAAQRCFALLDKAERF
eukprot:IDg21433t1